MKKVLLKCAAAGLLIAGSSAFAAAVTCPAPVFHPWYVGGGVNHYSGMSEVKHEQLAEINKLDKTKISWDIFGGYELTPRFGTELGYADVGRNEWFTQRKSSGRISDKERIKGWLAYFDGIYYVQFCKITNFVLKVFAKGGADYLSLKYEDDDFSDGIFLSTDHCKLHTYGLNIGCGIQAEYNQFGARLGYTDYQAVTFGQKYHMSTTQTGFPWHMTSIPNLLYLDAMYHFG
jgi:hypothetical protein